MFIWFVWLDIFEICLTDSTPDFIGPDKHQHTFIETWWNKQNKTIERQRCTKVENEKQERERERESQTDRQADRQTHKHRHTNAATQEHTFRHTDRQTDINKLTGEHTCVYIYIYWSHT